MLLPDSKCSFDPTPCVQVFRSRVSNWVTMDMCPLDGVRNPDVFIAGQLHQFLETWEEVAISSSYDRADEVSLAKFFKPFKDGAS